MSYTSYARDGAQSGAALPKLVSLIAGFRFALFGLRDFAFSAGSIPPKFPQVVRH